MSQSARCWYRPLALTAPLVAVVCLLGVVWLATPHRAIAAGPAKAAASRNCFEELARGRSPELICEHPAWLAAKERDDLRRMTGDLLRDARCSVSIRIDRHLVMRALTEPDVIFEAPPQPVVCEISSGDRLIPIHATFAPRVVIREGVAVDATPGMADVTGVSSYIAWPVVQYVNRSATMRDEMLAMINAYLMMRGGGRG